MEISLGSGLMLVLLLFLIGYFIHKINYKYAFIHTPLGVLAVFLVMVNMGVIESWFDYSFVVMSVFAFVLLLFGAYKDFQGVWYD